MGMRGGAVSHIRLISAGVRAQGSLTRSLRVRSSFKLSAVILALALVYAAPIAILVGMELAFAWLTFDFQGAMIGVSRTNHARNMKSKLPFVLVAVVLAAGLHPAAIWSPLSQKRPKHRYF
jgi:hypothetical protein